MLISVERDLINFIPSAFPDFSFSAKCFIGINGLKKNLIKKCILNDNLIETKSYSILF